MSEKEAQTPEDLPGFLNVCLVPCLGTPVNAISLRCSMDRHVYLLPLPILVIVVMKLALTPTTPETRRRPREQSPLTQVNRRPS